MEIWLIMVATVAVVSIVFNVLLLIDWRYQINLREQYRQWWKEEMGWRTKDRQKNRELQVRLDAVNEALGN